MIGKKLSGTSNATYLICLQAEKSSCLIAVGTTEQESNESWDFAPMMSMKVYAHGA
jgi:hypothetical protein